MLGFLDQARFHRVEMDIAHDLPQVFLRLNEHRLITPPKECPVPMVSPVITLGINSIDMSHHSRKIGLGRLKTQMIVIPHETISIKLESPSTPSLSQDIKESLVVGFLPKNRLPCHASIHDVVDRIGILDS
jgi:hypothetical protein